ncbi:MAG: cell division protein FtsL [Oscillospiraceae bacterium]|jgi:cell division protein FtsL|nr:cell division protein FtsL [Oscillospiraceae bacterium]
MEAVPARYGRALPIPQAPALPKPAERPARELPRLSAEQLAERRAGSRVAERNGMKLTFRAAFLFAAVFAILLVIVHSYMQISQLAKEFTENTHALQALKREERTLTRQAEAGVSLTEVEDYARDVLKMVKPNADQIVYISMAGEDAAEVIPVTGFWGGVKQLFSTAMTKTKEFFD